MPKVIITITDETDGSVQVVLTPDLRSIAEEAKRTKVAPSPAQGYAIHAALAMRDLSRRATDGQRPQLILPPGLVS